MQVVRVDLAGCRQKKIYLCIDDIVNPDYALFKTLSKNIRDVDDLMCHTVFGYNFGVRSLFYRTVRNCTLRYSPSFSDADVRRTVTNGYILTMIDRRHCHQTILI